MDVFTHSLALVFTLDAMFSWKTKPINFAIGS